jgi:Bifunctional DNA primase/polymerase, N-terminal
VEWGAVVTHHTHNIETARRAIAAGLYIFGGHPVTKKPLVKWREQSSNAQHAVAFFEGYPAALVCIDCGKSGLFVADYDMGHADGADGLATLDSLFDQYGLPEQPPMVWTPRGGLHQYWMNSTADPLGNRAGILPGMDTRGVGGFVIACDSVMATGQFYEAVPNTPNIYEASAAGAIPTVPGWLYELARRGSQGVPSSLAPFFTDADADRLRKWALGALNRKASELAGVQRGGRNHALNRAVFVIAGKAWCGLDEREVYDMMVWACTHNRLIADDGIGPFNATFKSGWDAGILKPLPGPRERLDEGGVKIQLESKLKQKEEVG